MKVKAARRPSSEPYAETLGAALQRLDYDAVDTLLHALCDAWEESRHDQAAFVAKVRELLQSLLTAG